MEMDMMSDAKPYSVRANCKANQPANHENPGKVPQDALSVVQVAEKFQLLLSSSSLLGKRYPGLKA